MSVEGRVRALDDWAGLARTGDVGSMTSTSLWWLFRFQWGAVDRIEGGLMVVGQVTPPA